jgi:beta-glucosidase
MKALAAAAYRFSISWPRIFPQGTGAPNPKGLDFYNRLLDNLVANDIAPFPTLYHWDLPQALQDRGGWETRDTAEAFADYAGYVAEKLSDRARHFFTLNECAEGVGVGSATDLGSPKLSRVPAMRAVAFTELEPSSPLAGIGGMSESPAGSSKRGDYP